jgi:hypothetical protein
VICRDYRTGMTKISEISWTFLRLILALCGTFADLVLTELGLEDRHAAQSAVMKSEEGYATIVRFLTELKDDCDRLSIEQQLNDLRTKLDSLHRHFRP